MCSCNRIAKPAVWRQRLLPTLILGGILISSGATWGQTTIDRKGTLSVTARIVPGCGLLGRAAATELDFGTIDFGSLPATATGEVRATSVSQALRIECSTNVVIDVAVDAGSNATEMGTLRNLAGPNGALVPYRLFLDEAGTQPLDAGQAVSTTMSGTIAVPIYGQATLPGGSTPPGTYKDVAHITLTY